MGPHQMLDVALRRLVPVAVSSIRSGLSQKLLAMELDLRLARVAALYGHVLEHCTHH